MKDITHATDADRSEAVAAADDHLEAMLARQARPDPLPMGVRQAEGTLEFADSDIGLPPAVPPVGASREVNIRYHKAVDEYRARCLLAGGHQWTWPPVPDQTPFGREANLQTISCRRCGVTHYADTDTIALVEQQRASVLLEEHNGHEGCWDDSCKCYRNGEIAGLEAAEERR